MTPCEKHWLKKPKDNKENDALLSLVMSCDSPGTIFVISSQIEGFYRKNQIESASYRIEKACEFYFFPPYFHHEAGICFNANVAHLAEQLIRNQQVASSTLAVGSIKSRVYVFQQHINPFRFSTTLRIYDEKLKGCNDFIGFVFHHSAVAYG